MVAYSPPYKILLVLFLRVIARYIRLLPGRLVDRGRRLPLIGNWEIRVSHGHTRTDTRAHTPYTAAWIDAYRTRTVVSGVFAAVQRLTYRRTT